MKQSYCSQSPGCNSLTSLDSRYLPLLHQATQFGAGAEVPESSSGLAHSTNAAHALSYCNKLLPTLNWSVVFVSK